MTKKILFARSDATLDPEKWLGSFPIKNYDFVEFFKMCSQKYEIVLIKIDLDEKIISLMHQGTRAHGEDSGV